MKSDFSCEHCPLRRVCDTPCAAVEALLPNPERGRMFSLRRNNAMNEARRLLKCMREARFLTDHRELLDDELRRVFDLTYNEGLSQAEIAERLGIHRHSVGSRLDKARQLIMRRAMRN